MDENTAFCKTSPSSEVLGKPVALSGSLRLLPEFFPDLCRVHPSNFTVFSASSLSPAMRLVVTGCNGSVGQNVVASALKRGHNVLGIDRTDPIGSYSDSRFTFISVDLTNYTETLKVLAGYDAVVHLAGTLSCV